MASASSSEQRRQELRLLIQAQSFASLGDLAERLGVSDSTVRRDLDYLEEQGEVRRTHGGVVWTGSATSMRIFAGRRDSLWERKRAIARRASELISDNETILLDGGSTTYELARNLLGRPLQVVTNSLPVANLFAACDSVDLIMLGGYIHVRTGVSLGPFANQMLEQIRVRRSALSIAGADSAGYYNSNLLLVETEQAMIRSSGEVMIVADSSKFGHASLSRLCGLDEAQTVVTDDALDGVWRERLRDAGVNLIIAESTPSDS